MKQYAQLALKIVGFAVIWLLAVWLIVSFFYGDLAPSLEGGMP